MSDVTDATSLNNQATALSELAALHAQYLVSANLISSGTGANPIQTDPVAAIRRPWLDPPEGFVSFDQAGITLVGAPGTISTVVTLTVPDGYDGVINALSWNYTGGGFAQGSGDLIVQILRNSAPIRNYDNITFEKGSIQQPRAISPIRIYSRQVITMVVNHAANLLLVESVIGSFLGYFYPSAG